MKAGRVLAASVLVVLGGSRARADEGPSPAAAKKAADTNEPATPGTRGGGGFVVFVDPVTGKIRQPDPAEIGGLVAAAEAAAPAKPAVEPPLAMKFGPGGAVGIVLDSRYESFVVVTKAPDGRLAMDCVTGAGNARKAVAAGAGPAPKPAATGASDAR
jgi:hypothetical protein